MHTLILGMTESGKTTLAKLLHNRLRAAGKTTAVLDPLNDPGWEAPTYRAPDAHSLIAWLKSGRGAFVFVDESGAVFDEGRNSDHLWLATRSRHWGHSVFFMAQRVIQVPRTMRDQCGKLYLFTSAAKDGELHADEWNDERLRECNTLPRLHFYAAGRYARAELMRICGDYSDVEAVKDDGGSVGSGGGAGGGAGRLEHPGGAVASQNGQVRRKARRSRKASKEGMQE